MKRLAFVLFAVMCACSSTTTTTPLDGGTFVPGDSATDDVTAPESGDDDAAASDAVPEDASVPDGAPAMEDAPAGACNALKNDAPTINAEYLSGPVPAPKGGTIADGVYVRSRYVIYDAVTTTPITDKTLVWFRGGRADFVQSLDGKPDDHFSATYATEGSGLILTQTCPKTVKSPYSEYDATATTLVFYDRASKRALHYTRR